jgi:hypothetical protein
MGPAALLVLGGVLLLAAVICFFAYNWADMGLLLKLGLPLAGLVLCGAGVWRYGPLPYPGRFLPREPACCAAWLPPYAGRRFSFSLTYTNGLRPGA